MFVTISYVTHLIWHGTGTLFFDYIYWQITKGKHISIIYHNHRADVTSIFICPNQLFYVFVFIHLKLYVYISFVYRKLYLVFALLTSAILNLIRFTCGSRVAYIARSRFPFVNVIEGFVFFYLFHVQFGRNISHCLALLNYRAEFHM